jgi:hypothetical protein
MPERLVLLTHLPKEEHGVVGGNPVRGDDVEEGDGRSRDRITVDRQDPATDRNPPLELDQSEVAPIMRRDVDVPKESWAVTGSGDQDARADDARDALEDE